MEPLDQAPPHALGHIDAERVARLVERAGDSMRNFYQGGRRSLLTSPMFNVPGRMVVGGEVYFRRLPELLRELTRDATPEDLGGSAGALCSRPHYLSMQSIMHGYLNGREQRRLEQGLPRGTRLGDECPEDLATVMDFWDRVMRAYLHSDRVLPEETEGAIRVLSPEAVAELAATLEPVGAPERLIAVRRAMATVELYTFISNGESRVGVFHYGPYPLPDGDVLMIKELNGLQDRLLPWVDVPLAPFDNAARVMKLHDVDVRVGLFGTLVTDPVEYEPQIVAERLVTRDADGLRTLSDEELEALRESASTTQLRMYGEAATWEPTRQVAYGGDLYAALLIPWFTHAGIDAGARILADFRSVADEIAPALAAADSAPLLLTQLGSTEGEYYEYSSITSALG